MNKRRRPRRPIKLTDAEYAVVQFALTKTMLNDRLARQLNDEQYQAGMNLVTHTLHNVPLYKLGHTPVIRIPDRETPFDLEDKDYS